MLPLRDSLITLVCTGLSRLFAPRAGPPTLGLAPRIVVLKPCCLGDLILATPAVSALRRAFPRGYITVLTGRWARPAVEHNPDCDRVLDLPSSFLAGVRVLRRGHFDAAVVLDRSPSIAMLALLAGIPVRSGLDSGGRGFSLTHRVPVEPLRHEAALYLDAVKLLVPGASSPGLRFTPSEEDEAWVAETLPDTGTWVALHPGGGVNPGSTLLGKRWPVERFGRLAVRLIAEGHSVLLVGGVDDVEAAKEVMAGAHGGRGVLDMTGRTSFGQLGALLARCRLFVGNDTGPMHLAVAAGTPVVAVFGPSSPHAYGPWSARSRVVYHGEHCGRCHFRGGLVAECRNGFACIQAATEDEVWAAVQELLGS